MIDAIIISDLHLGASNCQAKSLCGFLSYLRHEIKPTRLILNGDVFDSFDVRLRKWHWEVLSDLRKLSDELELVWVCGNHDRTGPAEMVSHLFGAKFYDEYIFESGNKSVLCMHGDQWDQFIAKRPFLTWLADQSYRFLQQIDPTFYISRLAKRSSKMFLRNNEKVAVGAIKYAQDNHHDIICCGHVHMPYSCGVYHNSGCWTDHPSTYLTISKGLVELKSYYLGLKSKSL